MLFLLSFFIFIFVYIFPYFWAMAISSAMNLNIKLKFQILLSVFLFVFVGFCAVYCYAIDTDHTLYLLFLAGYVIGTPLWVLRFYLNERTSKVRFYIGLVATLFILWEMEVLQRIIFYNITKNKTMYDIEIVDDSFEVPITGLNTIIKSSEENFACIKNIFKCPLLPKKRQLLDYIIQKKDNKEILIAKTYTTYYGKSLLLNYLENLDTTHSTYRTFYVDWKNVVNYLENLKSKNQKSSQKGENNGND